MHILLVNTNPVVSRLMFLILASDKSIMLDEVSEIELGTEVYYDILFIDEKCCSTEERRSLLRRVHARKKILFATSRERDLEGVDRVIRKPFLPSEITSAIQSSSPQKAISEEKSEQKHDMFGFSDEGREKNDTDEREYQILDGNEMEKIKQLLFEEGLSDSSDALAMEMENEALPLEDISVTMEQKETNLDKKLLEALVEMKPKKIRKLLEGAEVSITIRFPKEV